MKKTLISCFLCVGLCLSSGLYSQAQQNYSLQFNGTSDNVSLPALSLNSNTVTFEAWIKPSGAQNAWSGIIVSENNGTNNNRSGLIFRNNNELGYMWEDSHGDRYGWSSGLFVPSDKWSYVAMVVTPVDVTLYLNGTKMTHIKANDVKALDGITRLGTDRAVSGRFFKGLMDEVRIWNVSRTNTDILAGMAVRLTGAESGLLAYYHMDDQALKLTNAVSPGTQLTGTRTGTSYVKNIGFDPGFGVSKGLVEKGQKVSLTDLSLGFNTPTSWKWTVAGPTVFSSNLKNPSFTFTMEGTYDVKLVVSDGLSSDSLTKTASIIVAKSEAFDSLFFVQKKNLLTAVWNSPFSYSSIKTNHAPMGPYMGNGDVGVVCHTSANSQTLHVSKVDFVTDGWSDWAGSGPAALPVGGIKINVNSPTSSVFRYEMDQLGNELRMTTATTQPVKMKSWMAVDDNIIVTELTTTSATPVSMSVETYADSTTTSLYPRTSVVNGDVAQVTRQTKTSNVRWVSKAGVSTRILGATATVNISSSSKATSSFSLTNTTPVYVLTYVSGGGKTNDAKLPAALSRLNDLTTDSVTRLKNSKSAWWKDMWTRSYVETNDDLLNRHYLSSVYLLASGYNRHSPVCGGMYGVWNMNDSMMYHGDIHLNYNSQAGFYSVFSANRPELAMPFYSFIESIVPDGKIRAQRDMGILDASLSGKSCRGVLFLVGALGIGVPYNYYWKQTMNAPFNVPLFSWYYEYTGDIDFLRNRAYPFIIECGNFYEDYLKKESYGDSYRYTITTGAHESSWDYNPPSDIGFVEQTFRLLLKYSKVLGVDENRRALWQDIVSHLPKYKVIQPTKTPNQGLPVFAKNEAGWDYPNHMIQMHPVYPCEVLNLLSNPDTVQIAKNTIQYFQVDQNGFTGTMNELGLSAFVMAARVGFDPDVIVKNMKALISSAKPNFLIVDGHHCAEKTTPIETVNSMMLQTIDSTLLLFPDWIKSPASFTRLRAKGAFLVSADYDGSLVSNLKIFSEQGTTCMIKNPWPGSNLQVKETQGGNASTIPVTVKNDVYSFPTKSGATYMIDKENTGSGLIQHKQQHLSFRLYPNPASTEIKVVFVGNKYLNDSTLKVLNGEGKVVLTKKMNKGEPVINIDVASLANGVYFVSWQGEVEKVIIRK